MENHISPASFKNHENVLRMKLRYGDHGFDHAGLERVGGLLDRTAEHLGEENLTAKHYDKAMEFMAKQPEWQRLGPGQQEKIHSAFKTHLGIPEEPTQ